MALNEKHGNPEPDQIVIELGLDELGYVAGGTTFQPLSSAISEVMKNFGGALQTAARGG